MNDAAPLAALADIELPAPPDWRPLIALAAVLLIVAGAALLYLGNRKRTSSPVAPAQAEGYHTTREALARLAHLQQEWTAGALDARAAAYRLGTLLRLGLGLPQLHPGTPPAGLDTNEWRETLTLLQDLRYAPAPVQRLTPDVFARAQRWLSRHETTAEARDV